MGSVLVHVQDTQTNVTEPAEHVQTVPHDVMNLVSQGSDERPRTTQEYAR